MSLKTVDKVLLRYGNVSSQTISWFNWGEPLLHREFEIFAGMVKGTRSAISSNFSLRITDARMESLQNFRTIYVSMSGITPELYQLYNVGGDLSLVMSNLKRLSALKCRRVIIRWESHRYNAHQQAKAKDMAEGFGFGFEPILLNCMVEEQIEEFWHPLLSCSYIHKRPGKCKMLKWTPIDVDGNYLLCCASRNVKIGYNIDDNVSDADLVAARLKTDLCTICRDRQYWRMYS